MNKVNTIKKVALAASISLAAALVFSCSSDDGEKNGEPSSSSADDISSSSYSSSSSLLHSSSSSIGETSSDVVSCRFSRYPFENLCSEISISKLEENGGKVSNVKAECDYNGKDQFLYEGCPAENALKCNCKDNKICVMYLYDEEYRGITCDKFWELHDQ
jgi:hypothetical protein